MTNLVFSTGTYKEYQLNGSETIRINVSDPGIVNRLKDAVKQAEAIQAKYGDDVTEDNLVALNQEIRGLIDKAINCPGACDKAFGAVNCLAIAGGRPIFVNFLDVLLDQLKRDIVTEQINERSAFTALENERTQKFITQSTATPFAEDAGTVPLALLSQSERERLIKQLQEAEQ